MLPTTVPLITGIGIAAITDIAKAFARAELTVSFAVNLWIRNTPIKVITAKIPIRIGKVTKPTIDAIAPPSTGVQKESKTITKTALMG